MAGTPRMVGLAGSGSQHSFETFYTLLSTLVSESCVTWLLAKAIQWPGAIGLTPEDLALVEGFQEGRGFQAWNEALSHGARTAPGTKA